MLLRSICANAASHSGETPLVFRDGDISSAALQTAVLNGLQPIHLGSERFILAHLAGKKLGLAVALSVPFEERRGSFDGSRRKPSLCLQPNVSQPVVDGHDRLPCCLDDDRPS